MSEPPPRRLRDLWRYPRAWRVRRRVEALEARSGVRVLWGNEVEVLDSGSAAFAAMASAIEGAREAVAVEMYTWADDRLGRRMADVVAAKARSGVPVLVLLDAFGSFASGALARAMESAGVAVRWYHPLAPWTPRWYPNRRDHRKLVIVDGTSAFVGGMNFAEEYAHEFAGDDAWRDLGVSFRGPAVREAVRLFLGTWAISGGSLEAGAPLVRAPREAGAAGVQLLGGGGRAGYRVLRNGHLALVEQARHRILIANAYFVPSRRLVGVLVAAARRGLRVDLLLPTLTDVPLVRWASRATYGRLLEAGVAIREHRGAVLHAKAAVVDGAVLLAGSANLDYRSFRHNLELAVSVVDAAAASAALRGLESDWERATPVDLATWRARPVFERLLEAFATGLRYWL